jgi:SNF2 family DNA or RNA helicase
MNDLLKLATIHLTHYLNTQLPKISDNWWQSQVISKLSYQQQRLTKEKDITELKRLDLSALLRLLDRNWNELYESANLPYEGRNWVKEMQTIRNKWAHSSTEEVPHEEKYRDIDTLGRLLKMLQADTETVERVEAARKQLLQKMAGPAPMAIGSPAASSQEKPSPEQTEASGSFIPGQLVALKSDPSSQMPVMEQLSAGTENRYKVFHNGQVTTYFESQLQALETPTENTARTSADELTAYITSLQLLSPSTASLFSLRSGRVNFVPYQYRPVLKLIKADRPRLLIADEVGVGKTIEAGLIIKELRARMDIQAVLIICPKALVAERKWELEMKRFDEKFTNLDGGLLRHCLHETHLDGEWPDQYSKAILPFSLFDSDLVHGNQVKGAKKRMGLLEMDPPPKFDLVIVDEAHHIRNSETFLHQGVRQFCDNANAVVFLTATPVQLGSYDLYTMLNALRPDLVIDYASFERMAEPNTPINEAILHCRKAEENWPQVVRESLETAAQTEWGRVFLSETPEFQAICDELEENTVSNETRIQLIRKLEELYTFSSLINRTRRRDIGTFTTRKPKTLNIPFTEQQQALHDDVLSLIAKILEFCHGQQNVKFMMTTVRRQAASSLFGLAPLLQSILGGKLEQIELLEAELINEYSGEVDLSFVDKVRDEITTLINRANNLDSYDPKLEAFIDTLKEKALMANNKALVFSTFRHTLSYLQTHVEDTGLRIGLIHGSIPDHERADLRRRFSLDKEAPEAIDVLLSSEVGCEGLDFQFCDLMINYDLPWNPMRVEQRIGRIDRYGQKSETVAIVNLITPGTVDADIYERCLIRIGVFNNAIGGSEEILGKLTSEIQKIANSYELTTQEREERLKQLADNEIREVQEIQVLENKQAELFGLNIPTQKWEDDVKAAESIWLTPASIQQCVTHYLTELSEDSTEYKLSEKPLKSLRLKQNIRERLLKDYKKHFSSKTDPVLRNWEKWLKGATPNLTVTFLQETANNHPEATFLNVLHPLVRQAALFQGNTEARQVSLQLDSTELPAGEYAFAIYRWKKLGIKKDEALVVVADTESIEPLLLDQLAGATNSNEDRQLQQTEIDALEQRHHRLWRDAQAQHIAENQSLIAQRQQSLKISHQARRKLLEDHIASATNSKIQLMKQSELNNADTDYERRQAALEDAARCADIHANLIAQGTVKIS